MTARNLAFLFGVTFVVVILVLALWFPHPTPFQYFVFRVVLSLAAAGVAAVIPGFLNLQISHWLRAGGALAVFAVVYYFNPASLVVPEVLATASVDCAQTRQGNCAIFVSIENNGLGSLDVASLRYRVVEFQDLGGKLGAPPYVPDELGDLDLSSQVTPTPLGRWAYVHPHHVKPIGRGESATVTYRATAKELGTNFGLWTLQAQLHTSASYIDLGSLQLMLPYWEWKRVKGGSAG